MIIAIDGPAASGKGTLARRIAEHFALAHLDTGSLYRAVARDALAIGLDLDDAEATARVARKLDPGTLGDPALKERGIGEAASIVARHPQVRAVLLHYQRVFARRKPGTVIDGRDIGTVVCPDADAKIFVTADLAVRARRRWLELREKGEAVSEEAVRAVIAARDKRDSQRAVSPLAKAADADLLDTTDLDIEQAFKAAVHLIERKLGRIGQ